MNGQAVAQGRLVQTPLLARLFESIPEDQRLVVLDLGRVSSTLLAALQPYRARLDGLSVPEQLSSWQASETLEERRALIQAHLSQYRLEQADWLMCWSVLNYLDGPTLGILFEELQPYLKPSARIHALIEYSAAQMPQVPPRCDIHFDAHKLYLDIETRVDKIPSPRYTPKRLEGMLHGMKTQSTILLSNGMQEFVFTQVPS